jgi:drug/metabolite transporter (DMT)-like permease
LPYRVKFQPIDLLLLLMAVIWGSNFTVVKIATRHISEFPFNGLRLLVGTAAFLVAIGIRERWPRLTRVEWQRLLFLAVVGHVFYQICFLAAVARTTVANNALIFAFTPIAVALLTSLLGHERIAAVRWVGALISLTGIYLVVGANGSAGSTATAGNLFAVGAVLCWAVYTVGARPLLERRSAVTVTGYSMALGSLLYMPLAWGGLRALRWETVPVAAWAATVASGLLALFVAYMIWYTAVQTIGSARTSMYSNVTPLAAMVTAAVWLGEPITGRKLAGAALVMTGLAVTKLERRASGTRDTLPPTET